MWSTASHTNLLCLQRAHNNILRALFAAPLYARNSKIHDFLEIGTVLGKAKRSTINYRYPLGAHLNPLPHMLQLPDSIRRLKDPMYGFNSFNFFEHLTSLNSVAYSLED